MALKTLYNRDTGQVFREKINDNFDTLDKRETTHYSSLSEQVQSMAHSAGDIISSAYIPSGDYLPCDGRIILKDAYPELFDKIYDSFGLVYGTAGGNAEISGQYGDSYYGRAGICALGNSVYVLQGNQMASTSNKYYQTIASKYTVDSTTGALTQVCMHAAVKEFWGGNNLVADSDGTLYYTAKIHTSSKWWQTIMTATITESGYSTGVLNRYDSSVSKIGMVKTPLGILTWDNVSNYFQKLSGGSFSAIAGLYDLNSSTATCCGTDVTINGKAYFIMCGVLCSYDGTDVTVIDNEKNYTSCLSFDQGLLCVDSDSNIVFIPEFSGGEVLVSSSGVSGQMYRIFSDTSRIETLIVNGGAAYKIIYNPESGYRIIAQVGTITGAIVNSNDPSIPVFVTEMSRSYSSSSDQTQYSETITYISKTSTPIPNIAPSEGLYTGYICTKG